ncbi:MAG TPA: nucleotidyltransferase domain-containing protein [Burkholderiales bacterium]
MSSPDRIIAILRERLPGLVAVYRFGSEVTRTTNQESDLDLAVLCDKALSALTRFSLAGELVVACGRPVDMVDLSTASTVICAQVVSTGERLFCADPKRCDLFEDITLSSYARLNEERGAILRDVKARESVYGR